MQDWQLQDAKNRFSEVVKKARDEGPQTVTVHGQRAAVDARHPVAGAERELLDRRTRRKQVDPLAGSPVEHGPAAEYPTRGDEPAVRRDGHGLDRRIGDIDDAHTRF